MSSIPTGVENGCRGKGEKKKKRKSEILPRLGAGRDEKSAKNIIFSDGRREKTKTKKEKEGGIRTQEAEPTRPHRYAREERVWDGS